MEKGRSVTLKHLLIQERRYIGLQFNTDKVIHALVKQLPDVKWSNSYNMACILNTKQNLDEIFKIFNGVVWVNCNHFFDRNIAKEHNETIDITWFRKRELPATYRVCPLSYLDKLELRKYANNTVKTYVNSFETFINYYNTKDLISINESDVRDYILKLIQEDKSNAYINLAINSIKFY